MIYLILTVLGLCLGSFANALVWRVHEQETAKGKNKSYLKQLSITKGRSMCPHCKHELAAKDLVPLLSWLSLRGKCRYCSKPISVQYPIVELATAALFVASFIWWPNDLHGLEIVVFGLWLPVLVGLTALTVYDIRWFILPNRIVYPLGVLAGLMAIVRLINAHNPGAAALDMLLAVIIGGGFFYLLFQVSAGKWIGGGDVKLGWLLGLVVGTPGKSLLFLFFSAALGTIYSLPLLATKKLKRTSTIPFGPFLIAGAIISLLFGDRIIDWYMSILSVN